MGGFGGGSDGFVGWGVFNGGGTGGFGGCIGGGRGFGSGGGAGFVELWVEGEGVGGVLEEVSGC